MEPLYILKPFSICLNMIVKNESRIIERMLQSVAPYIDAYCICDTGSTDNTIEVIHSFFAKTRLAGKVVDKYKFVNFEETRNVALKEAQTFLTTHILLMDADMLLEVNEKWGNSKQEFDAYFLRALETGEVTSFSLCQGTGDRTFFYENVRIVPNPCRILASSGGCGGGGVTSGLESVHEIRYLGVTHEYVNIPSSVRKFLIPRELVYINDVGDGGAKGDKHDRDIRLLKAGIEAIEAKCPPGNSAMAENDGLYQRYHFYLANALFCAGGRNDEAKFYYRRRIALGGWNQEVWYSHHRIGLIEQSQGNMGTAIQSWLEAYKVLPERAENLYEIVKYYRCRCSDDAPLAHVFYKEFKMANRSTRSSRSHHLFNEEAVYTHLMDYEFTVYGFYLPPSASNDIYFPNFKVKMWIADAFTKVLNYDTDGDRIRNSIRNLRFYGARGDFSVANMFCKGCEPVNSRTTIALTPREEALIAKKECELAERNNVSGIKLRNSSTCISEPPNGSTDVYWAVTRLVNYYFDEHTRGYLCCEKHIITVNLFRILDAKTLQPVDDGAASCFVLENVTPFGYFIGMEDVRFVCSQGAVHFIGTTDHPIRRTLGISYVRVPLPAFQTNPNDSTRVFDEFFNSSLNEKRREREEDGDGVIAQPSLKFLRCAWCEVPRCEKNWVFVPSGLGATEDEKSSVLMIYNWSPGVRLCRLDMDSDTLHIVRDIGPLPGIFSHFRGSTNGLHLKHRKQVWFLVHLVSTEDPRHYFHAFVVFDDCLTKLVGYTNLFKLSDQFIEYAIGMAYEPSFVPGIDGQFVICYSTWDRTTMAVRIPYLRVTAAMHYVVVSDREE
jgi:glycosyltransferase involved in cell wall biosynthesis